MTKYDYNKMACQNCPIDEGHVHSQNCELAGKLFYSVYYCSKCNEELARFYYDVKKTTFVERFFKRFVGIWG